MTFLPARPWRPFPDLSQWLDSLAVMEASIKEADDFIAANKAK